MTPIVEKKRARAALLCNKWGQEETEQPEIVLYEEEALASVKCVFIIHPPRHPHQHLPRLQYSQSYSTE